MADFEGVVILLTMAYERKYTCSKGSIKLPPKEIDLDSYSHQHKNNHFKLKEAAAG